MTIACADAGVIWAALFEPPTLNDEYLAPLLRALGEINLIWLRDHRAPALYMAGIRYRSEPEGEEHWRSIPQVLSLGHADCKSLAAWRVAELRHRGVAARFGISSKMTGRGRLWHITVILPNGQRDDPSARLGMNEE